MKTKYWIIILAVLALASALCTGCFFIWSSGGEIVGIYSDGELVYTVDLSDVGEDQDERIINVTGRNGENTVLIDDEGIRIISATCPDKLCVEHGILFGADPIVCLPNRVVIRYIDEGDAEFDAVA